MRVVTGARHGHVVESARPFAGIVQADREVAVGQPGEESAAGEALQIDDPVEFQGAHLTHAGEQFIPVEW